MTDFHIKQEMLDRSSPTISNTSSRAQTVSSTAESPSQMPSQATYDSDATMSALGDPPILQDAMQYLGADSRRLIQGIKKLEELNINTTLQLPKFVVVGDQSAGKSSIVEALCDISLPRSQGTCTRYAMSDNNNSHRADTTRRCPFKITTSSAAPANGAAWLCRINIQQEYYFHTDGPKDPGRFCEREGQAVTTPFATVDKRTELEPMLRKAQLAVLNPSEDPQNFVGIDLASASLLRQVPFSPNVISLEIQGPDLPELYFYDLPGSINVIEDEEDPGLPQWIEELVNKYLRDEKCLILLACGADQDVETSTTFRFIKNCGATQRCAGVLTKADLMPPGKLAYIRQILNGKKFTLGKGWFFTKQLSQAQIDQGISHAMARNLEADFFRQQPWSGIANLQSRFGIERLQEAVSESMTDHIRGE
jgi:hypothetical protein